MSDKSYTFTVPGSGLANWDALNTRAAEAANNLIYRLKVPVYINDTQHVGFIRACDEMTVKADYDKTYIRLRDQALGIKLQWETKIKALSWKVETSQGGETLAQAILAKYYNETGSFILSSYQVRSCAVPNEMIIYFHCLNISPDEYEEIFDSDHFMPR